MKQKRTKKGTKIILLVIYLLLVFAMVYFVFSSFRYQLMYKEAIKQGAEGIVTCLELNVACQSLCNITIEQVKDKWIDMFLKNKTRGGKR